MEQHHYEGEDVWGIVKAERREERRKGGLFVYNIYVGFQATVHILGSFSKFDRLIKVTVGSESWKINHCIGGVSPFFEAGLPNNIVGIRMYEHLPNRV